MTEQELEKRMKDIIEEYSPILDAKPIEEIKAELKSLPNKKGKEQKPLKKVASIQTQATSSTHSVVEKQSTPETPKSSPLS